MQSHTLAFTACVEVVGLQPYSTCLCSAARLGTPAEVVREQHLQPRRLMLCCFALLRLQERVSRCLEAIQATVALPGTVPQPRLKTEGTSSGRRASPSSATVPQSPTGVLDAAGCLSYRSDDTAAAAAASHASSSWCDEDDDSSPVVCSKRRKISR